MKGGEKRGEATRAERRGEEHHGALESSQDCQMPDTDHQLPRLGNVHVGQEWMSGQAGEEIVHHAQASSTVVSPPATPQSHRLVLGPWRRPLEDCEHLYLMSL